MPAPCFSLMTIFCLVVCPRPWGFDPRASTPTQCGPGAPKTELVLEEDEAPETQYWRRSSLSESLLSCVRPCVFLSLSTKWGHKSHLPHRVVFFFVFLLFVCFFPKWGLVEFTHMKYLKQCQAYSEFKLVIIKIQFLNYSLTQNSHNPASVTRTLQAKNCFF